MTRKSLDESDRIYRHVKSEIERIIGARVKEKGTNVWELPKPYGHILNVHISTAKSYFWNFYRNKIQEIERETESWSILLVGGRILKTYDDEKGDGEKVYLKSIYNISSEEYQKRVNGYWTEREDGGFKINDEGQDLRGISSFASVKDALNDIIIHHKKS
ncbi:hypothetical protein [Nitrososphaera viennensis]|uniref:Uncharacterized protein n=2 Tax=Nitrososphaera viennensis TaxID=1034015 RepID=A0A060HIN5_9ARCH|nr:hypothetical protein [Nitrososphaera viennensis]AIC16404.1 hypothetical protein NVIE_021420 [Nitrososphaera viennensis EN76]UVS68337.1 hypothetical protein NWT39_10555 [Nitrososphaera viennensis]